MLRLQYGHLEYQPPLFREHHFQYKTLYNFTSEIRASSSFTFKRTLPIQMIARNHIYHHIVFRIFKVISLRALKITFFCTEREQQQC